jgi:hypothetical protein
MSLKIYCPNLRFSQNYFGLESSIEYLYDKLMNSLSFLSIAEMVCFHIFGLWALLKELPAFSYLLQPRQK